uniref:Signal transducer and activator of transcription 1b n=1 Tax=Sander lucioperca TaxID=283035 RepID=A0A8D0CX15_SANLU
MAQWQELLRLDSALQSRVSQLYDERKFPREIRHYLCVLLEGQDWGRCLSSLIRPLIRLNTCCVSFVLQIVLQQIVNILNLAQQIVATLTDVELPEWKCRQQMACIGSPVDTSLDNLQEWFRTVADVLLRVREQLQKLQDQNKKYNSTDTSSLPEPIAENERFTQLFALVVEKQPIMSSLPYRPQVLKTGVRFTVAVRFRHFVFNNNDCRVLDMDTPRGGLVAEFRHMVGNSSNFQHDTSFLCALCCRAEDLASSLPVVVISSTNQVVSAWASVMWCNMLSVSEPRNLSLFVEPPPLTWQQLSQALSWQFLCAGQRELDQNQLSYLRDKLVGEYDPDGLVHWSKFSKVSNENAWIWIDGILDLIKKHLVDLWRDGFIMGFVSREKSEVLLQEKQSGTFLLRFSESNKEGAITFSWVEHSNGDTHVHAVAPYTKNELSSSSLPNVINNYSLRAKRNMHRNPLIYLYPDIHKDTAFGHYNNTIGTGSFSISPREQSDFINNRTTIKEFVS